MSKKLPIKTSKTAEQVLIEQMSIVISEYHKAALSERVKQGLARRKAVKL